MTHDIKTNAATQAKKRWNAKHYTQINVAISQEVAAAFKAACAASGESMASTLGDFMVKYSHASAKRKPSQNYAARRQRRSAVEKIVNQLAQIKDAEETSRDNIPENLQGSTAYETADECVDRLEDVIEILSSIYY